MEYIIVITDTYFELKFKVSSLIKENWIPQGGVSHGEKGYLQAMIRNNDFVGQ